MEVLVLWEVSRKQDYIFASNKLKENIGASIIIEEVTEDLPFRINKAYRDNLIYNGGGSSLYKFDNTDLAREFVKIISEETIRKYPGIEVFMVIEEYDEENDKIIDKIGNAYKKLAIKKNRRTNSGTQNAFGIERICEATGLPASYRDTEDLDGQERFISEEVKLKIKKSDERSKKFDRLLPEGVKGIKDFRDLAKGEKNYLAVIHIDGNKMGQKFDKLKTYFSYEDGDYAKTNREYLTALRKFSDNVRDAFENAFKAMTEEIKQNQEKIKDFTYIKDEKFPVIPIIVAGDDITYVTNGKIGIESARVFLEHLNKNEIEIHDGETISLNACAGVAIARVSYPFSKTYQLAEDLCNTAKRKITMDYPNLDKDFSLIDWHIEQGDLMGTISEIREEHYKTLDDKNLCMRPLYLNNDDIWTNYSNFKIAYENITNREIYGKKIARNKIKELREVLKKGEKDTQVFLKSNNIENYFSRFENTIGDYCFYNSQCMYYDAIEAIDLFIELDKKEG